MRTLLGHLWNPLAAAIYGLNLMTVNALGTLLWFNGSSYATLGKIFEREFFDGQPR